MASVEMQNNVGELKVNSFASGNSRKQPTPARQRTFGSRTRTSTPPVRKGTFESGIGEKGNSPELRNCAADGGPAHRQRRTTTWLTYPKLFGSMTVLFIAALGQRWMQQPDRISRRALIAALDCGDSRREVLDVLIGACAEFELGVEGSGQDVLTDLPRLAASDAESEAFGDGTALGQAILAVVEMVNDWPVVVQDRLRAAVGLRGFGDREHCGKMTPARSSELSVVESSATEHLGNCGGVRRTLLHLGAASGLPRYTMRAEQCTAKPASVLVASRAADGPCFAFRGKASISFAVRSQDSELIKRVMVEQPHRWDVPNPRTSPRYFSVFGDTGDNASDASDNLTFLGAFEYAISAPAIQVFDLVRPVSARALRVDFEGPGWGGANYTCVYRVQFLIS